MYDAKLKQYKLIRIFVNWRNFDVIVTFWTALSLEVKYVIQITMSISYILSFWSMF